MKKEPYWQHNVLEIKEALHMADINIHVDETLKNQAELILSDLGISLSTATTIFLKQVVRYNGIPFELRADPFYSTENQSCLRAAKERMEKNGGTVHELIEVDVNPKPASHNFYICIFSSLCALELQPYPNLHCKMDIFSYFFEDFLKFLFQLPMACELHSHS